MCFSKYFSISKRFESYVKKMRPEPSLDAFGLYETD